MVWSLLLADIGGGVVPAGVASMFIWLVIVAAIAAVAFIGIRAMGVSIPPWVMQVFWIVVIAAVVIVAIRFLMTL